MQIGAVVAQRDISYLEECVTAHALAQRRFQTLSVKHAQYVTLVVRNVQGQLQIAVRVHQEDIYLILVVLRLVHQVMCRM